MLRVRLLGELRPALHGRTLAAPHGRRAWGLLGWLALHPGAHPRGTVAARFWPDVLESSARASLRSAAWTLRQGAGEGALGAGPVRTGMLCEPPLREFDALVAGVRLEEGVARSVGQRLAAFD